MRTISFTTILVDDMAKAVDFYESLGFAVIKKDHFPAFVLLQSENHPIALHQVEKLEKSESNVILGIACENLSQQIEELKAKGINPVQETPQKFFGGLYVGVHDPAGNLLELIQWTPEVWQKYSAKMGDAI